MEGRGEQGGVVADRGVVAAPPLDALPHAAYLQGPLLLSPWWPEP